jgi:capsular polysaccharide transport system permease protein
MLQSSYRFVEAEVSKFNSNRERFKMLARDNPIMIQARIVKAIVLRDLRTRFGRTFLGSMIIVAWPLSHLLFMICLFLVARNVIPIGTDSAVFFGTGILPYILCLYPVRWIMFSVVQNRALLGLPAVKTSDIILARCIVEIIAAFWVTCIFVLILFIFGVNALPHHANDAILAILATIYLAFAMGWTAAVMYALVRAWLAVQIGCLILMYFTSGVFFIPTNLPEKFKEILWYNPLLHSVEWLRSAYYEGYGYGMLSRSYLLWSATVILFIGLVIERAVRGRLMIEH